MNSKQLFSRKISIKKEKQTNKDRKTKIQLGQKNKNLHNTTSGTSGSSSVKL